MGGEDDSKATKGNPGTSSTVLLVGGVLCLAGQLLPAALLPSSAASMPTTACPQANWW